MVVDRGCNRLSEMDSTCFLCWDRRWKEIISATEDWIYKVPAKVLCRRSWTSVGRPGEVSKPTLVVIHIIHAAVAEIVEEDGSCARSMLHVHVDDQQDKPQG